MRAGVREEDRAGDTPGLLTLERGQGRGRRERGDRWDGVEGRVCGAPGACKGEQDRTVQVDLEPGVGSAVWAQARDHWRVGRRRNQENGWDTQRRLRKTKPGPGPEGPCSMHGVLGEGRKEGR